MYLISKKDNVKVVNAINIAIAISSILNLYVQLISNLVLLYNLIFSDIIKYMIETRARICSNIGFGLTV